MDNNNWRGRGRGRGGNRGGGGNRNYDNDYDNNYSSNNRNAYNDGANISITSRLGPTNNPINERIVHKQPPQQNDYNNRNDRNDRNNYNDQERGGRAFSSNNYRGRGGRGRGGGNNAPPRFTREFVDEDIDMKP